MLKAMGVMNDRQTLMIGLSFGNLKKFVEQPLDTYIRIIKEEMGLPFDIMIFSGRTEEEMADYLKTRAKEK